MNRAHYIIFCCMFVSILSGCNNLKVRKRDAKDSLKIERIIERQRYGQELRNKGKFFEAVAQHDTCISMANEINDTVQLIIALNNQGTNYRRLSDLREASNYHFAALKLCDAYSDKVSDMALKNHVRSLNGLGNVMTTLGNLEAAEEMLHKALEGERKLRSATGEAINLANIGRLKEKSGKLDSARVYYEQSMALNRKAKNVIGISLCYQLLGHLDELAGKREVATVNYLLSLSTGVATGDAWHWFEPCAALANLYIDNHCIDSAQVYVKRAMNAAVQIKSKEHLAKAYMLESRLEELRGQPALALADFRKSNEYADSVKNEENTQHVYNLRLNYEAKKNAEAVRQSRQQAEFEHKVSVLVSVSSVLFLIFFIIIIVMLLRINRTRKLATRTLEDANLQLKNASRQRQLLYRELTHQLRTPLTVVLGMVQQLRRHIAHDDKEGIADIDAVQRQSGELLQLVTKLINASKDGDMLALTENASMNADIADKPQSEREDADGDVATNTLATDASGQTGQPLVVIAEDNDDVAMLMCNAFRDAGYAVMHARDGVEALDILRQQLPELVVTDIAMPNMDGLELMRAIRQDEDMNHLPIIVVSARVEDAERLEGISAGAEVYMTKPFIVDELLLRAHKLIEQRILLQQKFSSNTPDDAVNENLNESEREFLGRLNEVIDDNLMQSNLNSAILSQLMFMSRSQLNRKIKNITSMDTTHYIRDRRMLKVKHLLTHTDKSIGEIEMMCGFDTQGYLSRMFKQEMGVTPSAYRRNVRK